jgi:hypothetical protein
MSEGHNRQSTPIGAAIRPGGLLSDFERSRRPAPTSELSPTDCVAAYLQKTFDIPRLTALRVLRELRGPFGPIVTIDDERLQTGIRHLARTGRL